MRPQLRPLLKPALDQLWRDRTTLQLGADPADALVLTGVDDALRGVLGLLDGTRDLAGVLAEAGARGADPSAVRTFIGDLLEAGALDDAGADTSVLRARDLTGRDRVAPEMTALSLSTAQPGGALGVLRGRSLAHTVVVGAGSLGDEIGRVLADSGIGAVRRLPDVRTALATVPGRRRPTLLVVLARGAVGVDAIDGLERLAVPHLAVIARDSSAVVGPLVLPRATSCLRCHDLHRADGDPVWPLLALQLSSARRRTPTLPAALAALAVGTAAGQALAYVDGQRPATVDGTIEIRPPDWRLRRRSWQAHPDCPCRAAARAG